MEVEMEGIVPGTFPGSGARAPTGTRARTTDKQQ